MCGLILFCLTGPINLTAGLFYLAAYTLSRLIDLRQFRKLILPNRLEWRVTT